MITLYKKDYCISKIRNTKIWFVSRIFYIIIIYHMIRVNNALLVIDMMVFNNKLVPALINGKNYLSFVFMGNGDNAGLSADITCKVLVHLLIDMLIIEIYFNDILVDYRIYIHSNNMSINGYVNINHRTLKSKYEYFNDVNTVPGITESYEHLGQIRYITSKVYNYNSNFRSYSKRTKKFVMFTFIHKGI